MTGLTPVLRVVFQSWIAPAMEPWSVRLTAGISSSAARATRSPTRQAPSRIEYSEWTCRWTKSAWAIAEGHSTPGSGEHYLRLRCARRYQKMTSMASGRDLLGEAEQLIIDELKRA